MTTARLFEWYSQVIWPWQRSLVRKYLAERCRQCGISSRCCPLQSGVCRDCRKNEAVGVRSDTVPFNRRKGMQQEMGQILNGAQGAGRGRYDAAILFSGGKDSAYLAWRLHRDYPELRLLLLTVDNTFLSPAAQKNIPVVARRLAGDHVVVRPREKMMERMYAYAFTHMNGRGGAGTVDQFDGDFIHDLGRNVAAEMGIPLLVSGLSPVQVENILGLRGFESPPEEEAKVRQSVAGIQLADIFSKAEAGYWWDGTRWPADRRPYVLFPFYAWGYDSGKIQAKVGELGLIGSENSSPLVTNNELLLLMGVVDINTSGYSSFEPEFCRLIRGGQANRQYWVNVFELLEYLAKTGVGIQGAIKPVLERLKLSRAELGIPW